MGCAGWVALVVGIGLYFAALAEGIGALMQLEGLNNPTGWGKGLAVLLAGVLLPIELWWLYLILTGEQWWPARFGVLERTAMATVMLIFFLVIDFLIVQLLILLPF